jgi:hypothetical protein
MSRHTDETRVTAALPGLDVEAVFRDCPDENAETLRLTLRATPGFGEAARLLATPMLPLMLAGAAFQAWAGAARLAWAPWLANAWLAHPRPPGPLTGTPLPPAGPDRRREDG